MDTDTMTSAEIRQRFPYLNQALGMWPIGMQICGSGRWAIETSCDRYIDCVILCNSAKEAGRHIQMVLSSPLACAHGSSKIDWRIIDLDERTEKQPGEIRAVTE